MDKRSDSANNADIIHTISSLLYTVDSEAGMGDLESILRSFS